ncbi:YafY family protein [Chryseobacterium sp. MDT2-18]|uniref:helix-turn-helix transcriptional regulator n=1 Tax=Chryseobacterium sp. MDT2-18 TaxID=1259136 RepID=UPI0027810B8F|nr:WYL domain-containing protein [Chryseobacterium sp. MDT2-18]MDQ0478155.1 putative DNA-binding transcriptional regulator YafY [Chryseobacterium sp. MDT2-18]
MATNKNAQLRYKALDKCFSNPYKKFFIDDLIAYCSQVLSEHYLEETTVSRRQILMDLGFMKSLAGYEAPIESYKDGRKTYYRYSEKDFSILKKPLNPSELNTLNEALETLSRMNSLPGFDWVNSLQTKLKSGLDLDKNNRQIISFEENEFLKGLGFLNVLYQYISQNQSAEITYKSFKSDAESQFTISPYYLKQYNNRWFLFGWNHQFGNIQNLALDRIINIENSNETFINNEIDFNDYFEDIIGVSNNLEENAVKISIKLSDNIIPYIISKPIHGSQKISGNILNLELKLNYELESLILSFGENIQVLEPFLLVEKIKERINKIKFID